METQTLSAEVRPGGGKGPARQLRLRGLLPGVFYGPGVDTQKLTVSPKDFARVLDTEYGINVVLNLTVDGTANMAMVKDVQVHPVTRNPIHVDFYKVDNDRAVEVKVPFKTKGRAIGVVKGGKLHVVFRELPIRCTPDKIPATILVDVSNLDMNEVLTVADLELPEGVEVQFAPTRRVALITEAKKVEVAEEETPAAGAAPAADAPAAAPAKK